MCVDIAALKLMGGLGDTKVQHLGTLATWRHRISHQHQVFRFQVAMNDSPLMRNSEHICDLPRQL